MSQENVDLVRRLIAEFGPSRAGIEEAARVGLVAPDAEFDFSALYPDGPIKRGLEGWRSFTDSLPWGGSAFAPELASCERLIQSITRRAGSAVALCCTRDPIRGPKSPQGSGQLRATETAWECVEPTQLTKEVRALAGTDNSGTPPANPDSARR